MKQKWIVFALVLMLATMGADAQPKHRHHAVADTTAVAAQAADDEEIAAYSDTTNVGWDEFDEEDEAMMPNTTGRYSDDFGDFDDMPEWLVRLLGGSIGVAGLLMALLVMLLLFAPFILIIIVLRMMVRRHNDRVRLAEKAMETGQQIPEELMPVDKQSDEYLRRRGIRNVWIGIGMAIMFYIWDSKMLMGIGFLVLCYGIGQMLIARSSAKKNDGETL